LLYKICHGCILHGNGGAVASSKIVNGIIPVSAKGDSHDEQMGIVSQDKRVMIIWRSTIAGADAYPDIIESHQAMGRPGISLSGDIADLTTTCKSR
jgi:hypothetical protein